MNDSSSEEKNPSVLSEEARQKITGILKAFVRGREFDADGFEQFYAICKCVLCELKHLLELLQCFCFVGLLLVPLTCILTSIK